MNAFPSWCCSGFGKDVMCFPTLTFIWTEVSLNSSPLYLWYISGVLLCAHAAHVDRLKSSLDVQTQRWFHTGFKPLLLKGFQGLSHTVLQTSQFHSTDSSRNSQRHTLLALHCLASCWKAAGMCSFSLYLLKLSPTLYPRYSPIFYFSIHATLSSVCCHFLSVQKPFGFFF